MFSILLTDECRENFATYLNLQHPLDLSSARPRIGESEAPLRAPSTVPIVVWLELMVLNAQRKRNLARRWIVAAVHGTHTMTIMIGSVMNRFDVES